MHIFIILFVLMCHRACKGCIPVSECVTFPTYTESCSFTFPTLTEWKILNIQLPTFRQLGYTQTVANFEHWLGNTGNTVTLDKDWLLEYRPVRKAVENNINTIICGNSQGGIGIIGRGRELMSGQAKREKICYCGKSTSATFGTDLYGAVGKFTIHTSAQTCIRRTDNEIIFTMDDITHTFYDKYDWDPSDYREYYCLEQAGRAKSFMTQTEWKDEDNKMSGIISPNSMTNSLLSFLFDCKYERDDSQDACKSPPLIFVVDKTGSMDDDIAAVQSKIKRIIDSKKDTIDEPRLYVLSVFEASVTVTSTTDSEVILNAVNSISTSGGTENSMTAILRAAEYADEHSIIWLFTDEDADDEHLRGTVRAVLTRKKIKLNPFISGGFRRRRLNLLPTGIALYSALAFATGGVPIYTSHTEVTNVIDIFDTLTSRDTTTLYMAVKTSNTATTEIMIPMDSTIQKMSFIISTSAPSSSTGYITPYIIVRPLLEHMIFTQNITLATQSLYAMDIFPNNENSFGVYNVTFGTDNIVDFLLFQIVCETLLSFDFYLYTDNSEQFDGLYHSDFLTVTVVPSDVNLLKTVDSIMLVSRDGEITISNDDFAINVDGFSVTFAPNDYRTVNNLFHVAVSGIDANNYRFYRMMSEEIAVQDLQLNVLPSSDISEDIIVQTWSDVSIEIKSVNATSQDLLPLQFSAISQFPEQVELQIWYPIFINSSATAKLSIFVHDDSLIGQELYITLTAINTDSADYAHTQLTFTIVSNLTDTTPPQCQFINNTYSSACALFDSALDNCNSSFWSAVIYVSDTNDAGSMDKNYGVSWITTINDDPYSFTILRNEGTSNFTMGSVADELYLLYTSSCCNTYSQFIVRDQINQISNCELNVANKCSHDQIFGDAYLNETVNVNCKNIENNTYFTDGILTRKCMNNGKWEDIVTGACNMVTATEPSTEPTTQPTEYEHKGHKGHKGHSKGHKGHTGHSKKSKHNRKEGNGEGNKKRGKNIKYEALSVETSFNKSVPEMEHKDTNDVHIQLSQQTMTHLGLMCAVLGLFFMAIIVLFVLLKWNR